jgi:hypothetical protein
MALHQLVYVSAAHNLATPDQLGRLLQSARRKNSRLGITGLLIHHSGSFLQVLEGDEAKVEELFDVINADPRHHRIVVLSRAGVASPSFSEWSMGFVDGASSSLGELSGFKDLSRGGFDAARLVSARTQAFYLLDAFSVGRLRQYVST